MKPSPLLTKVISDLKDDVRQAPAWFGPAMACLLVWAAGGIYLTTRRHAALKVAAVLEARR